jgi:hypothetical protein
VLPGPRQCCIKGGSRRGQSRRIRDPEFGSRRLGALTPAMEKEQPEVHRKEAAFLACLAVRCELQPIRTMAKNISG